MFGVLYHGIVMREMMDGDAPSIVSGVLITDYYIRHVGRINLDR